MSGAREVEVRRDVRRAGGRIEDGTARLLVARAGELEEIALPEELLPDALARLLDLGPRTISAAAAPVRVTQSALSAALAGGDEEPAEAPGWIAGEREALRGLLAAGYVHWRVEVRGTPSTHAVDVVDLEVLDTGGLWLLGFDPPEVELAPTSSTAVFRRLAALMSGPAQGAGATDASPA